MFVVLLGYFAGTLTTMAVLPEIFRLRKTKRAGELSYAWLSIVFIGLISWSIYGFFINSMPLIVLSLLQSLLYFILIAMKASYTKGFKSQR
ncbi:MAG: SemiSWEET family sugar transporter [Candidatus Micrarchaeia archaeon]